MPHITSANIACGFHAGDPGVMRATVALARAHGVAVGAHPGLHDLAGFGRREMRVSPDEVEDLVAYQVGALAGVAAAQGVRLHARQAARRAVQHGGARASARRRDRARRARRGPVARAVRAVELGARRAPASARGSAVGVARRSPTAATWPTARWRRATAPGGVVADVDAVLRRAAGDGAASRRSTAVDGSAGAADGGHDVRARRHARRGRSSPARLRRRRCSARRHRRARCRALRAASTARTRSRFWSAASARRRILPTIVFGSSVRNSTAAGTL